MSAREFAEWMAYERIQPGPQFRGDIHSAQICSTIANVNRSKRGKRFKIADFILSFKENDRPKTGGQLKKKMEMIFGMMGVKFKNTGEEEPGKE